LSIAATRAGVDRSEKRGEALEVGEKDADLARGGKRLVQVQRAEALLVPLAAGGDGDRDEGDQHQHVPLPPRGVPVAGPGDHEHCLGEERERERDAQEERCSAPLVEPEVADGRGGVEDDADRGEGDLPAVQLLFAELAGERADSGERDGGPASQHERQSRDQRPCPAQHALGGHGPQRQSRGRGEHARHGEPERRRQLEALVLAEQHARSGERVQPEEPGRRDERERDEEEARVAAAAGGDPDGVPEPDAHRGCPEHEPEVRRMVLPRLVDPRVQQQEREHPAADQERECRPQSRRPAGRRLERGRSRLRHRSSWPCGSP
jgi:hypothetical protein